MKPLWTILLIALLAAQHANGLRILGLFPLNGRSHWVMGERLLTALAERGHTVDAVTHFPVKKPPPNYRDISLEGTREAVVNNLHAANVTMIKALDIELIINVTGDSICELLAHPKLQQLINNPPKDPPYDLVIVELFFMQCYLAFGRHLNVPMVGVMASAFHEWHSDVTGNPYNPAFMPGLFSPYQDRMTFWERLMNTFLTNMISTKLNYRLSHQDRYLKKYLGMNATIKELYNNLSVVLVNSHYSLNGVRPTTPAVIEVGGMHVKEDAESMPADIQKWLDDSKHGCILFTFGSMARIETFDESLVRTFYKVFEKIAPVRVLMKVAKQEELLPGLPKNVMIKPWFPQVAVLKHKNTVAFLTHGGLLSTLEAVHFGVPLVGIPLFGDQPINLRNVANKKIGLNLGSLDNVNEETLGKAIDAILHDDTYRTNMKKLSQLFKDRPMSPMDTAIFWVEYVARHGHILQSPAIHLNWWQQNLFDVYGFVLACLVLALYALLVVLRKLRSLLFGGAACHKNNSKKCGESKKNK